MLLVTGAAYIIRLIRDFGNGKYGSEVDHSLSRVQVLDFLGKVWRVSALIKR